MTTRAIKVKGEKLSFLAHADSAEQLITGTATGETPTTWNFKVKGTAIYWVDNDGAERHKEGTLTGGSLAAGVIKVHDDKLYYGDINGAERYVQAVEVFTPSLDGYVGHDSSGLSWANLVAAAGNEADDTTAIIWVMYIYSRSYLDSWDTIRRSIFLFDVSSLSGKTVTAAIFKIKASNKYDNLSISPDINLYESDPASTTELTGTDYATLGTTPYCDTPITYANWTSGSWMEFTLNADGLTALQAAIDGDGIFKCGLRNANYDASGTPPTWTLPYRYSGMMASYSESANAPQLEVTT